MSLTKAASMVVVLSSVTAFTAPGDPPDDPGPTCRYDTRGGDCEPPPYVVGIWELSPLGGGPPHGEEPRPPYQSPPRPPRPFEDPPFGERPFDDTTSGDPAPEDQPGDDAGDTAYAETPADVGDAPPEEPPGPSRAELRGRIALAAAKSVLGTPFSWGGGSPQGPTRGIAHGSNIIGFDCSGLALYAWSRAGVRLPHYTGSQFRSGRRVARHNLRPGDLVFFGASSGDPNHVGLNVGRGVMIHAPQTGEVVKRTDFEASAYYAPRYRGAVRPLRPPRTPAGVR